MFKHSWVLALLLVLAAAFACGCQEKKQRQNPAVLEHESDMSEVC